MTDVLEAMRVGDAHCHVQDDADWKVKLPHLRAARLAAMGVREGDWQSVRDMHLSFPGKVGEPPNHHTHHPSIAQRTTLLLPVAWACRSFPALGCILGSLTSTQ